MVGVDSARILGEPMRRTVKRWSFTSLAVLSLLLSWLIFRTTIAVAQQVADPNFDPNVNHPAYTAEAPRVLFDEAHLNFHSTQGLYRPFVHLVSNDGYEVIPNRQIFQPETLVGHDILVIANAFGQRQGQHAFSEQECDVVSNWVEAGGSLLLIADHKPFGKAAENLASRFGIDMSDKFTIDLSSYNQDLGVPSFLWFTRENGLLGEHLITQGRNSAEQVNQVMTFTGQSLSIPPEGQALLQLSASAIDLENRLRNAEDLRAGQGVSAALRAQGVALQVGRGRVVVLGEAAMLSAQLITTSNEGPLPIGMSYPESDNQQFALNLMHWLSGLLS
ncbi:hypothetical protein IQ265_21655 [Nodosilinea sp. LEGE 06152]|uniref:hypothetical protein n=1 Tax=Nodosilinea sp. LEGE 06152 TaxID=2777966 RepID=UPI0018808F58|nr:hypothetical protein [Nodosilinea sp. LEGE 06152]MBE9159414.1 hypothetical protein [Nodosilinea sp. LEGE 06152]